MFNFISLLGTIPSVQRVIKFDPLWYLEDIWSYDHFWSTCVSYDPHVCLICQIWIYLLQIPKWIKVKIHVIDPCCFEWVSRWNIRLGIFKSKKVCFDRKHRKCYFQVYDSKHIISFVLKMSKFKWNLHSGRLQVNILALWSWSPHETVSSLDLTGIFVEFCDFVSSAQISKQIVSKSESKKLLW